MFTALVDLALAAVAAQTGDADTCAQLLTPAAEVVRQGGMVDRDLLWLYARIGRSSEGPLAQMAWHLAREQAARLGDSAALAEAARHLDEQG
jgi:hypothetical protein